MHLCAESWGGVREHREINHFQVRKASAVQFAFSSIHSFVPLLFKKVLLELCKL